MLYFCLTEYRLNIDYLTEYKTAWVVLNQSEENARNHVQQKFEHSLNEAELLKTKFVPSVKR